MKQKNSYKNIFSKFLRNPMGALAGKLNLWMRIKSFFEMQAAKEAVLFPKSKYPLSFKPFLFYQGLVISLLLVLLASFFVPQNKINQSLVIKTTILKQASTIIAGGQPAQWIVLVKKSDITKQNYLVQLPKSARNINITTISAQQAKDILQLKPMPQLSLEHKSSLAPASLSKLFLADLAQAAQSADNAVASDIQVTSDAIAVDLLSQAPSSEESPVVSEEPVPEETPVVEEPPIAEEPTDLVPISEPELELVAEPVPSEDTIETTSPSDDPVIASEAPVIASDSEAISNNEIASSPEAPRNDEVTATDETATTENSDYVALQFTTPAPTITEQNTDTGKIVTVSSANIEKVDCEALNPKPAGGASSNDGVASILQSAGASLLNGFTSAIKSITKFLAPRILGGVGFIADLEQAVSDVIEAPAPSVEPAPVEAPATETPAMETPEPIETPVEMPAETPSPVESNTQDLTPVSDVVSPSNESGIVNPTPAPTETSAPVETPSPVDAEYQKQEAAYQACLAQQVQLTDVLASTSIPEIYKVGEESKIKIKWKNPDVKDIEDPRLQGNRDNGQIEMTFHAYDTNDDGYLDYVEWTVPHLSTQIFEIIFVSKAFQLDSNQNIIADIYDTVATQDGNYATVPQGNYVRVTFDKTLTSSNDITIYARPTVISAQAEIQVYPVYDDGNGTLTEGPKLETVSDGVNPDFSNIDHDGKYRVLLQNLQTPTDIFDLRVIASGSETTSGVDIDYIVDPDITYYTTGTLTSSNLFSGLTNITRINSFSYTATIPAVTGMTVQFSQNGSTWCDHLNDCTGTSSDILSAGTNTISLSTLAWTGVNFYYKIVFTSDGTDTPILDDVNVNHDTIITLSPYAAFTTATANGNIDAISEGNATVRGFEYGLTETGTWDVHEDGSFGIGTYSLGITGLTANTTYHIRAYFINPGGTFYGNWVSFLTSSYYTSGTLISTDLFSGETATSVDSFTYNLSAKPAGTEVTVQFSSDNSSWYNSAHVLDSTDTLTTGTNNIITLSGSWPGTGFYYKIVFTPNGAKDSTPVLDDISVAFTNDTTPPTVSSVAVQTGSTVNVVFSEPMGTGVTTASNYTVSGTGKGTLANNPNTAALVSGSTYVLTWSSGEMFNGGDITITVANAQDVAGNPIVAPNNSGTHAGGGIGVVPTVSITSPTTGTSVNASKVITFSDNETTSPQCSVDNTNWTACTSNTTTLGNISQFAGLTEGNTFTLYLKDTDAAGNIGTNNVANLTKDTTAPTGSITLGEGASYWTTNTSPTIALTTDDASQYQLCLNSATAGNNCSSIARAWASYTPSPAAYDFTTDGIKTLYVQFKDAIENISATYSDSITIDASAPNAATALAWSETSPHNATSVTASWTKSNSSDLANQKIQFYSDASCSATSGSLIDLSSNTLQTRAFTGVDGTTYTYKITSIDDATNETVSDCSSSMQIDTSAPTGTSISSTTADSTTQLTVTSTTATDTGVGLHATPYQFQETTGNSGATSSSWQAGTTYTDSGLSPNTQYTYKVRAKDILSNTSEYSTTSSKYTLADVPGTPTLTADSASQITVTLTSDSNPSGTYYLITNTTNATNSDWTTDASWASSGLTCNTAYTFTVKAKNGNNVETTTSTASASTSACASQITSVSGGLAPSYYLPPSPPLGGFQLQINNGVATTTTQDVMLTIRGSSETVRMSISNDSNFTNAIQESYDIVKQWRLSDGQGQKTVYLKFFTAYGVASNTITATINYQIPSIITPIINIITPPTPPTPPAITPIPPLPPVEEVVRPEAPLSMQDIWNLLPTQAINQFVLSPVPQEISDLVQKFPELAKTLEAIGIAKITDISKLVDNNLALPNISQIVNPIGSNLEPGQIVVPDSTGSPSLTAGQLANLEGIPLENLTDLSKQKIPTDILFVKTSGGLVDYNTTLSLNEQGHPQQQLSTIVNQPMQLIVKADSPARAIRGYFIFKQNSMKSASKISASDLTASLLQQEIDINQVRESTGLKQALVLSTFDFTDPEKDNIWTADIVAPPVDGQYDIIVVIDYQDQRLQPKELTLVTVVDPEGYVYTQMTGGIKGRVPNAKVSIYWLNPVAESYELWPAKDYQQVNPQITDDTGKYSFLVPEGTYYLKVEAKGYSVYQGNIFEVKTGNGIHQNIELRTQNWWLQFFDWKVVILIIFGVLLVYNFYSDMKRRKQNNRA